MSYKIVPNAKVLMSTDGTKELFIDTGTEIVPVNNRLCYSEIKHLTFDGDINRICDPVSGNPADCPEYYAPLDLYKISDESVPASGIARLTVVTPEGPKHFTGSDLQVLTMGDVSCAVIDASIVNPSMGGQTFIYVSCVSYNADMNLQPGTYVLADVSHTDDNVMYVRSYTSDVALESIKKIDDKYLPVGIPVITSADTITVDENVPESIASQLIRELNASTPAVVLSYALYDASNDRGNMRTDLLLLNLLHGVPVYTAATPLIATLDTFERLTFLVDEDIGAMKLSVTSA